MKLNIIDKVHFDKSIEELKEEYYRTRRMFPLSGHFYLIGNNGLGEGRSDGFAYNTFESVPDNKEDYAKLVLSEGYNNWGYNSESPTYEFNPKLYLDEYASEKKDLAIKVDCYRRYVEENKRQWEIANALGIDQSTVNKYIRIIEGKLAFDRGHDFEMMFEYSMSPLVYDYYVAKGGRAEYDGLGVRDIFAPNNIDIISLKVYEDRRGSITLTKSDLRPEIEEMEILISKGNKIIGRIYLWETTRNILYSEIFNVDFERCTLRLG